MHELLRVHAALLLRLARAATRGVEADAKDVAQEVAATLLRMHREGRIDPETLAVPEAYLRVAVRHAAARRTRRREDVGRDPDDVLAALDAADSLPTPEEVTAEAHDRRRWLQDLKAQLRPRDAVAFALLVEDGLTIEETARALGSTTNNVHQMRHRILGVAKAMLTTHAGDPP